MESLYSSPTYFESRFDGEHSCPDFDKLIQSAENANAELVRLLEEETQKTSALQKELDAQNKKREEHELSSHQLNEEAKELHKRLLQNKETNENLKKTNLLLSQHEEELQKKYEMACASLEQLRLQNSEVVERYQGTWKRYHAKYESSEMAGKLAEVKTATLKLQEEVNDTVERIAELKLQVTQAENEKKEMEDILQLGGTSPKKAIISLAEMYVEMAKKATIAKENFLKHQQKEREKQIEKEGNLPSSPEEQQNVQAMECETQHLEQLECRNETENVPAAVAPECAAPESSEPCQIASNVIFSNTDTSEVNQELQITSNMNTGINLQMNRPTTSQEPVINNGLTTINTSGLLGYTRMKGRSLISMPPSPLTSQMPTVNHQQPIDSFPITSTSQGDLTSDFGNTGRGDSINNTQDQVTTTSSSEHTIGPATDCQIQMSMEHTASTTNTKSPGPHSSYSSPKTPTSASQDIFNFGDYRETIQQISKSPGEGFFYQSRPMFGATDEEEGNGDMSTGDTQTSFFQSFFMPRQQELSDQFTATPTFFNMSPNKDQGEMDKQGGNQFQPHSNTGSMSVCGSLFSMSPGPSKESEESTSGRFALFGDQPAPKSGNHGNQLSAAKSPDFTFNFGASPCINEERSTSQSGTYNLF